MDHATTALLANAAAGAGSCCTHCSSVFATVLLVFAAIFAVSFADITNVFAAVRRQAPMSRNGWVTQRSAVLVCLALPLLLRWPCTPQPLAPAERYWQVASAEAAITAGDASRRALSTKNRVLESCCNIYIFDCFILSIDIQQLKSAQMAVYEGSMATGSGYIYSTWLTAVGGRILAVAVAVGRIPVDRRRPTLPSDPAHDRARLFL